MLGRNHRSALHRHQPIPSDGLLMKESSGGDLLSAGPQVVTCWNQVPPSVSVTGLETESASEREKDAHHPPRTPRSPPHCWPRTRTPSTRVLSSVMPRCFASSLWLLLRGRGSRLLDAPPTLCHNAGAPEEQPPIPLRGVNYATSTPSGPDPNL